MSHISGGMIAMLKSLHASSFNVRIMHTLYPHRKLTSEESLLPYHKYHARQGHKHPKASDYSKLLAASCGPPSPSRCRVHSLYLTITIVLASAAAPPPQPSTPCPQECRHPSKPYP